MNILQVESYLPDVMEFIDSLAAQYKRGTLQSEARMAQYVRAFFTLDKLDRVETFVPGWRKMAFYAQGATLVHVVTALTALMVAPEYETATPDHQTLAKWFVLLHDVEKEILPGQRDYIHGFRSAVTAGHTIARLGFVLNNRDKAAFDAWARLTRLAIKYDPDAKQNIQDNTKLPAILAGIDDLFGANTPGALIVKTVLLHMSITVLTRWPQTAPLTDEEIKRYINPELLTLLRIMMNVDNDAWSFFDPVTKSRHRIETRAVFERLEGIVTDTPVANV
ncbi:MAG: hypothetical protein JXA10_01550 [Anaerolineae bacterium]|nr:hypothetical protein [Anaerolineae bacterium]